ncbi:MAG: phosphoribosylaminoimidazolesuccinocarboxamide synthase, partial [Bacteroidota bacterium]|nr:phosphoribosylaminoimidazolesuccinocarboxamide synthase [Bacteroidota bacterium]
RGTELASKNGLILVDTKYEFGYDSNGVINLIDEIHTPDSSRYFYKDSYENLQIRGEKQKQLSKEFFREWLMQNGFQGKNNQVIPLISDEVVEMVSRRYIELYERLTGKKFVISNNGNIIERINKNLKEFIV